MRSIVILFFLLFSNLIYAQNVNVSGEVCGLGMQDVKLLKKLKKNINYEGTLSNVKVNLKSSGYSKTINTDIDGEFNFNVFGNQKYYLTISKKDYPTIIIGIDLRKTERDADLIIGNLNFLLENGDSKKYSLGVISYKNEKFYYDTKKNENASNTENVNWEMLEKAAKINAYKNKNRSINVEEPVVEENFEEENESETQSGITKIVTKISEKLNDVLLLNPDSSQADTNLLISAITDAKEALKTLEVNSMEYKSLQNDIKLAEAQLHEAKQIIKLKENEIKEHKKVILYSVLFSISLLVIVGLFFYFFRELKAKKEEIAKKNARIMSSMEYASLIQNALLNTKDNLNEYFSDYFVYYKSKEIVSGDFFWFKKVADKIAIAVADCTGHGVPGALLTMLGMSALERIVGENNLTDPSQIIKQLDIDVSKNLSDNNPFQLNGMDISIVVLDTKKSTFAYCGAMREIVTVNSNGELKVLEPEKASIASGRVKANLTHNNVAFTKGDTLFLFSDGFQDQFKGGLSGKVETYNYTKFNNLLIKLANQNSIKESNGFLEKELNRWKGEQPQTDDIVIIGLRV